MTQPTAPRRLRSLAAVTALAGLLTLPGCNSGLFEFHGTITTTKTVNGKTETKTQEFDNWEEMKVAMDASGKELRATTKELIKNLVEAPPPGEVHLSDLSTKLANFEGNPDFDFVANHPPEEDFHYVQIGVPSYDEFFRAAAEFHAFVYQTRESIKKLRMMAHATLSGDVEMDISLGDLVRMAMERSGAANGVTGEASGVEAHFQGMVDLGMNIAGSAPAFVQKTQALISTGQQLVTAAPSSITNPKTVLHLDLIVKGLNQSVTVVGDSGKLLGELAVDLATLRK